MTEQENIIYLVGDVKYTDKAKVLYDHAQNKAAVNFLLKLQSLMEEFGVVKVDLSTDAFKYSNCKSL
ncbi:hypothetical protein FQZ97_1081310 [compost metagenome]